MRPTVRQLPQHPRAPIRSRPPVPATALDGERALAHLDRLYRAALALTQQREEAEDLVHDVVESLVRRPRRVSAGAELGYLLTMLRHRHFDALRRRRRRPAELPLEDAGTEPSARLGEQPHERIEQCELLAAVASLRGGQRDVLVAIDLVGLSYQEAAASLGIPIGTVMSRLHRARASVVRELEREPGPSPVGCRR